MNQVDNYNILLSMINKINDYSTSIKKLTYGYRISVKYTARDSIFDIIHNYVNLTISSIRFILKKISKYKPNKYTNDLHTYCNNRLKRESANFLQETYNFMHLSHYNIYCHIATESIAPKSELPTSELHTPPTSELHMPPTPPTTLPPLPTSELHTPPPTPPTTLPPLPTLELHTPLPTSELHTPPTPSLADIIITTENYMEMHMKKIIKIEKLMLDLDLLYKKYNKENDVRCSWVNRQCLSRQCLSCQCLSCQCLSCCFN